MSPPTLRSSFYMANDEHQAGIDGPPSQEDVTEAREHYSDAVLEHSLDAYIVIDSSDVILEWNRQAEVTFGWTRAEVLGTHLADKIIPDALRDTHRTALANYRASADHVLVGRRTAMPALRRGGGEITVELSIVQVTKRGQPLFVASLRDITALRAQEAEIVALTATLEKRVARRTEELGKVNRELQAANQQLESFARNVAHDLRGPLRAVDAYTTLVLDEHEESLGLSAQERLLTVLRQVRRMQALIDDLLRLAFIGRQPVQKQAVNLRELIVSVTQELLPDWSGTIEVQREGLECTYADPALLEHALRNLVSNAFKYSRGVPTPKVIFGSEVGPAERVYFVKDNGIGFEQQYSQKLFQPFQRLHRQDQFEGTGVGLTIVKNVIEKHGGRVWAQSQAGEGATFYFTLPELQLEV